MRYSKKKECRWLEKTKSEYLHILPFSFTHLKIVDNQKKKRNKKEKRDDTYKKQKKNK
jgi:hypothetical protein